MKKPEVGQRLYSLNVGSAARGREQVLTPVTVTKVGRKYFSCLEDVYAKSPHMSVEYHLDNWRQRTEYTPSSILYISKDEWENEKRRIELNFKISEAFRYGSRNFTLEQLEKINDILFGEKQ